MDADDNTNESSSDSNTENLTPEQVEAAKKIETRLAMVNEKFGTPDQRAEPILNRLREILDGESTWDMVCACTAFLGQVAPLYMLEKEVQQLGFQVHLVHYFKIEIPEKK